MNELTDDEIRDMTLYDMETYTETHPEEAWRFAKILRESATKQLIKGMKKYGIASCNTR